jgi:hypothetical protein
VRQPSVQHRPERGGEFVSAGWRCTKFRDQVRIERLERIELPLDVDDRTQRRAQGGRLSGIVARDSGAYAVDGHLVVQDTCTVVVPSEVRGVLARRHAGHAARIHHDGGGAGRDRLERAARGGEDEIVFGELTLGIDDDSPGTAAERGHADTGASARLLDQRNVRFVLGEDQRARRALRQRPRSRHDAPQVDRIVDQRDARGRGAVVDQIVARVLVDRDETADLRQEQRLAHRIAGRLAQLQRGDVGKAHDALDDRRRVAAVDDVRRLGQLRRIVDDGDRVLAQGVRGASQHRRIRDRAMAAPRQPNRPVAHVHFGAARLAELVVGQQDAERTAVQARPVAVRRDRLSRVSSARPAATCATSRKRTTSR